METITPAALLDEVAQPGGLLVVVGAGLVPGLEVVADLLGAVGHEAGVPQAGVELAQEAAEAGSDAAGRDVGAHAA